MCALCGAFCVADHWTDNPTTAGRSTGRSERQLRAGVANCVLQLFGLRLGEWSGRFILSSRTGKQAVVDHFGVLWPDAERLAGRHCDPLDPTVIEAVERMVAP